MAFEGLTEKLSNAFKKLRGKGRLSEADVKESMREIRLALLEADVNYKVVKDFIKKTTGRCVGTDVLESLTPAQIMHIDDHTGSIEVGKTADLICFDEQITVLGTMVAGNAKGNLA